MMVSGPVSSRRPWRPWRNALALALCLLGQVALAAPRAMQAAEELVKKPWEYSPYAVEVWLLTESPEISPAGRAALVANVLERAEIVGGATWRTEIVEPPTELRAEIRTSLEQLPPERIQDVAPASLKKDKIIIVVVESDDYEYRISALELDCRTRIWGTPVERSFRQPQRIAAECFEALAEAFLPMARIEDVRGKEAVTRVRASGLFYGEPSPATIEIGSVLQPIMRHNDRLGEPKRNGIFVVPWTYIHIEKEELSAHVGQVYTSRRGSLGGRASARVERYGRLVRTRMETTDVLVLTKGKTPSPVVGYEIYSKNPELELAELEKEAEQQTPAVLLGQTDWRGQLRVAKSDHPLRILYVKSGAKLLARLPLVPGAEPLAVAEITPDDQRLQIEGFVKGIQAQVMDLVSRKHLLAAKIRKRLGEKKLDEAQQLLDEMRSMPTKEQLLSQIASQETKLTETSKMIDELLSKAKNLVSTYITQKLTDEMIDEVAKARQGG